ncbi:flagellar filament capping protein FliD [Paenibacillus sp. NPDC058071]|uniref:flagellar filament capping protein FliD n=1 Tax=Paenibacillus sp. NPDC058071 TaxID=3346326 RepID=UPI0036D7F595
MPMRITGMSSGLDTEKMIKDLMKAERMPINKLLQKKQSLEWKVESYSNMNLKIASLRESVSQARFSGNWSKLDAGGNVVRISEDEMVAKIKDIVNKYNDTVSTLNTKTTEKVYRNYQPLTSEEKDAMSDRDIAAWEDKAKSGNLRNDNILGSALSSLRKIASTTVGGGNPNYDTLTELGIMTPAYSKGSPDNGKLIIDETKLRAAIQADPDAVVQTFTSQTSGNTGLFQRIFDIANDAIISISRKINGGVNTAESLNMQIDKIDSKVEQRNKVLDKKEDRYYAMFANMEKAISNGNSQLSWLSSQFS